MDGEILRCIYTTAHGVLQCCVVWRVSRVSEVTGKGAAEQEPLFTRNVGNRDLSCFLSVTFRRLRGGGGSIVCVSCTFCIKAKVHHRYLSLILPATVQAKTEIILRSDLTRFGFHLHLLVDICHPFSVFLSVSGTLFRPLPYLKVTVFLPSGLFFTLSTKEISFL